MQTRIVDSANHDDACDVMRWLTEVVGAQVTLPGGDEDDVPWLFRVREYGITNGTELIWDEGKRLEIRIPLPQIEGSLTLVIDPTIHWINADVVHGDLAKAIDLVRERAGRVLG